MEISNKLNRYDSTIQPNQIRQATRVASKGSVKEFTEAYRVDISQRARQSAEFNDNSITFPIHDSDILQYSQNLDLTYKS
ncbi:hypothetical protein [Halarcobacter anaerophilus]|uniref:hypothetical protein n=1 Tax=Halarcobacter anaerophilus TaxID=877500 RepID=UPI0005C91873|nr:hypothetical protein [Halarcobacter anaerophilus]